MNARQKAKLYKKMLDENNKHKGNGYLWLKIDGIDFKPEEPMPYYDDNIRLLIPIPAITYQIRIGNMVMECTPMSKEDTLLTINEKEFDKVYDKFRREYVEPGLKDGDVYE